MSKLKKQSQVVTGFDYEILDSEQRIVVQQRTGEIKERLRRSAQDIWEIGQKLAQVRSRLKHGQFETWLKAEFGWSRRTAYNFINVYEALAEPANLAQYRYCHICALPFGSTINSKKRPRGNSATCS